MAVWIPPDMDHWMRYGPNEVMIYVDVDRQEAAQLSGRHDTSAEIAVHRNDAGGDGRA